MRLPASQRIPTANDRWVSNFDQFFCRAFHYALIAAHIVFIGSTPRLAEDVVRLVPVFPPVTREGVSSVPAPLNIGVGALGLLNPRPGAANDNGLMGA